MEYPKPPFTGNQYEDSLKYKLMQMICQIHKEYPKITFNEDNTFSYTCCCPEHKMFVEENLVP